MFVRPFQIVERRRDAFLKTGKGEKPLFLGMPVFDKKKATEDIGVWLAVIGLLTVLFFVAKLIVRNPPLLLAVAFITPIIGLIWSKFNISLFDDCEMKNVAIAMLVVSFFCSLFIGTHNGKVESYFQNLLLKGEIVEYQMYVEEQEQYEGRKIIPAHYETAYRFEPDEKGHWLIDFIQYSIMFICFGFPFINYRILVYASKKTDKIKERERDKLRNNRLKNA